MRASANRSAIRATQAGIALCLALCVLPASASAISRLSYPVAAGALTVTAGEPAAEITISQTIATACTICNHFVSVQSPQRLDAPDAAATCTNVIGDGSLFQCRPLPSHVQAIGSSGADRLVAGGTGMVPCPSPVAILTGLGGADELRSGCASDVLGGGEGRDILDAGPGNDDLDGGTEADVLRGGDGDDALRGGDGRDLLVPGIGRDAVSGGPSIDTVSYEERSAAVTVGIGGGADDGEAGEADTVADDIENIIGGNGNDAITGSAGTNDIDAGPGADTIDPGGGADVVDAGPGNDSVSARDGAQDLVVCGEGADQATIDAFDTVDGCETVAASRQLMADVDNDGLAAGDCNDNDASIRPGLPDRPGDGIDGDCAGGDAAFPRVLSGWAHAFVHGRGNRYIRYTRLDIVDVPDRATIELVCRGLGCFKGVRRSTHARGASVVKLARHLRSRRLRPRSVVEIRITRPDTVGKILRFRTLKGSRPPTVSILCRRPGSKAPHSCARA